MNRLYLNPPVAQKVAPTSLLQYPAGGMADEGEPATASASASTLNAASEPGRLSTRSSGFAAELRRHSRQRRPAVLRGLGRTFDACVEWNRATIAERAGHMPIRVFVSPKGQYHLDGTWHPRTVLTCSMSSDSTIGDLMADGENESDGGGGAGDGGGGWFSRYALDEAFDKNHPLSSDLPSLPVPAAAEFPPAVQRQLFLANGPTQTQLHRDPFDNVYVCCEGERRWTFCHR